METIFTVSPLVIHPYTRHHKKLKKKKKTARRVGDAVGSGEPSRALPQQDRPAAGSRGAG